MKLKHVAIACAVSVTPVTAFADDITVEGTQMSRDFACDGQNVIIAGQGNTVELTGNCGDVKVMGADHKVRFDQAKTLAVSGMSIKATGGETGALLVELHKNTVQAKLKSESAPAEASVSGVDQNVSLTVGSAAKIDVQGTQNALSWTAENGVKAPAISTSGIGNKISKK
ncbi:DUF3060 domain-containing protein [Tardiphaga alba]|uniref:DUF3060 domain-containing protein n=1 Tax=Tardiphaga alba TaxID=340268 RepID=A0ABX8A4B2_9BRAD|nr:DUF3060 domain-containing protein [Tardiphaga alba]QUS38367.1 DUF3060 domain-containing protein [Tardiphaga alba]